MTSKFLFLKAFLVWGLLSATAFQLFAQADYVQTSSDSYEDPCQSLVFQKTQDSIPIVINLLGAAPQFDLLRKIEDPETFYKAVKSYSSNATGKYGISSADIQTLNDLLKCIGYSGGVDDPTLSASSFERNRFYRGVRGMVGSHDHSYTYSVILNSHEGGVINAWKIDSKTDKSLYILSTCGNAFVHMPDSGGPPPIIPPNCNPCEEAEEISLPSRIQLAASKTLTREVSIPIYAEEGCCRGTRDTSLIEVGTTSFAYQATAEVRLDTVIDTVIVSKLSYEVLEQCTDYQLIPLNDTMYYGLKPHLSLTSTEAVGEGLRLPGYRYLTYNDNILRVSVGTEFSESVHRSVIPYPFDINQEIQRETRFEPMFSLALGFEKYLDNCFYLAIDGLYGNKKISDSFTGPTELRLDTIYSTVSSNLPSPLHYIGLSTTLLYELKRCGKGLKIGVGPHFYHGISSSDNDSDYISDIPDLFYEARFPDFVNDNPSRAADFSYGAIGLHGEIAVLITDRIELFGQAGFNNHKYQNFRVNQLIARIGAKYAFSEKEEFRKMKSRRSSTAY